MRLIGSSRSAVEAIVSPLIWGVPRLLYRMRSGGDSGPRAKHGLSLKCSRYGLRRRHPRSACAPIMNRSDHSPGRTRARNEEAHRLARNDGAEAGRDVSFKAHPERPREEE